MYNIKTDTHTHTLASGHAYSTAEENARAAAGLGLEALAITDHYSPLFHPNTDFTNYSNFWNMHSLPKNWFGVEMYYGAEADIVSMKGDLFGYDLTVPHIWNKNGVSYLEWLRGKADFFIASIHVGAFAEGKTKTQITDMYCKAMEQEKVIILGHLGRDLLPFELKEVVRCAKSRNVLIEFNEVSFSNEDYIERVGRELMTTCALEGVRVSVGSDAHCSPHIGNKAGVVAMMEQVSFPEELIATATKESFSRYITDRI